MGWLQVLSLICFLALCHATEVEDKNNKQSNIHLSNVESLVSLGIMTLGGIVAASVFGGGAVAASRADNNVANNQFVPQNQFQQQQQRPIRRQSLTSNIMRELNKGSRAVTNMVGAGMNGMRRLVDMGVGGIQSYMRRVDNIFNNRNKRRRVHYSAQQQPQQPYVLQAGRR